MPGETGTDKKRGWLDKLFEAPGFVWEWVKGKADTLGYEMKHAESSISLIPKPDNVTELKQQLTVTLQKTGGSGGGGSGSEAAVSQSEQNLLRRLHDETARMNRNNVTRTASYWQMYRKFPELHWSFLAHMVSRNGGWTMTDLKGELVSQLLNAKQIAHTFDFLESANSLIFGDAYPQLLLYEESKRAGRPLFHLLPKLNVSAYMRPVWELFWKSGDSTLLTIGLIVNEQHYIEKRLIHNEFYRKNVLDTLFFKEQSFLRLNQVLFPYFSGVADDQSLAGGGKNRLRLAGVIIEDFNDIQERIGVGKTLYGILFGIEEVYKGAVAFAESKPHSGSRADYWPHLFASVRRTPPKPYTGKLDGCGLKQGEAPLFSPMLVHAWPERPLRPQERGDWFASLDCLAHTSAAAPPLQFERSLDYCSGLHKMELAILAGKLLE